MCDRRMKMKDVHYCLFGGFGVLASCALSYWLDGEMTSNTLYGLVGAIVVLLLAGRLFIRIIVLKIRWAIRKKSMTSQKQEINQLHKDELSSSADA